MAYFLDLKSGSVGSVLWDRLMEQVSGWVLLGDRCRGPADL